MGFELKTLKDSVKDGKLFSVRFIKRTDGQIRDMVCRLGVRYKSVGEQRFIPEQHNLITVYDFQKKAWRNIPVDAIIRLKAHGHVEYGDVK